MNKHEKINISSLSYQSDFKKLIKFYIIDNNKNSSYIKLISENDINKDHFVYDFYTKIKHFKNNLIFNGIGSSYLKEFPFQVIKEMFYHFFDCRSESELRKKLFDFTESYKEDITLHNLHILQIINHNNKNLSINMSMIYDSFRTFFQLISSKRKVVIIFEDIEYFDELSLNLLDYLARTLKKSNILFLITQTKRFDYSIKNIDFFTIKLEKLNDLSTERLSKKILKYQLSPELKELILENSRGNPYNTGEIIDILNHNNLIKKENKILSLAKDCDYKIVKIKNNVYSAIKNLNPADLEIVRIMSSFDKSIALETINNFFQGLQCEKEISNLIELGIIYINEFDDKKIIYFANREIQERIYQMTPIDIKFENHKKISNYLKSFYINNLFEVYEILAFHLERSNNENEAIYYYFMAGLKYREYLDISNALRLLSKSLFLAKKIIKDIESLVYFTDSIIECPNYHIDNRLFSIKISFKLHIGFIYYYLALTTPRSDLRCEEHFYSALHSSRSYNDYMLFLFSKIGIFHLNPHDYQKILENYISDINYRANELNNLNYFIFFLLEELYVCILFDYDLKNIENEFDFIKRLIFDKTIDFNYHDRCSLILMWTYLFALYKNKISNLDLKEMLEIIDESENYLTNDYQKIDYFYKMSIIPFKSFEISIKYFKKTIEISERIKDYKLECYSYSGLGYINMMGKKYKLSLINHRKAKELASEMDDRFELGMIHKNFGEVYMSQKMFKFSIRELKKSIDYKNEFPSTKIIDNWSNIIIPYSEISFAYLMTHDLIKAKYYIKLSDEILLSIGIFTKEIPIFIDFLKEIIGAIENKIEIKSIIEKYITKLSVLNPIPVQQYWLIELLNNHIKFF